jgi:hypothetical protein
MIRINADQHFTTFSAGCASQGTMNKVVKEDLKKTFFTSFKNISRCQSLDEGQIYGLLLHLGTKPLLLPIL